MIVEQAIGEPKDQFPIGMRVLAVDDDPACLLLLETLLRRCQYNVTTTTQAITALKLLRENKNKFDLVISDVHMPNVDGFKLLEHVGLEMDLPVIMLSGNGDPKLVMKGITHGACDYLLKPVRVEELKNIWQHVVRRRKFDVKDCNNSDSQDRLHTGNGEAAGMGSSDQNGKLNKKRKDQNEDEDEEQDENELENEDPSTQKKPRVVWSVELHRKFVGAVNQLGIDKAVPKKILDLMNVEKLTRENVASHLQKYRLYLKRISCVANQQANMAAALGSTDSPYLRMGSLNGLGNFHTVPGSVQFHNTSFRSFPPSGMLGRLNTPAGLGMRCLPSSGMVQLGHAQNSGNTASDQGKFQLVTHPGNHNGSILQGMPMSLELDQRQPNKGVAHIGELPTAIDNPTGLPVSSGFPDSRITVANTHNPLLGVTNNPLVLEGRPQEAESGKIFSNQSSVTGTSLNSGFSSHLSDHNRYSDNWSGAVQSSGVQPNSFPLSNCFKQATLHHSNMRDSISTIALQIGNTQCDVSSISPVPIRLQDSNADLLSQAAPLSSNAGQEMNSAPQEWDEHIQDATYHSNVLCNSINSALLINGAGGPLSQNLDQINTIFHRNMDFDSMGQSNFLDSASMKHSNIVSPTMETSPNLKEGYLMGQQKSHSSYISSNVGSLDDLVSAMVKKEQHEVKLSEGKFGCNAYSLRTCI